MCLKYRKVASVVQLFLFSARLEFPFITSVGLEASGMRRQVAFINGIFVFVHFLFETILVINRQLSRKIFLKYLTKHFNSQCGMN